MLNNERRPMQYILNMQMNEGQNASVMRYMQCVKRREPPKRHENATTETSKRHLRRPMRMLQLNNLSFSSS
jgi:hypothetical protein